MASSKSKGKKRPYALYAIPLVAMVLVGAAFGLSYFKPPQKTCAEAATESLPMDFKVDLAIQVVNKQGNLSTFIVPPNVGIPGASWSSHAFDSYGTDGRYPLCTDSPAPGQSYQGTVMHVRSNRVYNYTLRDFFDVWGQPLGHSQTDQTLNSAYVLPSPGYVWQMCIGTAPSLQFGNWTSEPLTADKIIQLVYYPESTNAGCIR